MFQDPEPATAIDKSTTNPDASHDENPYTALISDCNSDPPLINEHYSQHRLNRNAQQKSILLSPSFPGLSTDPILSRLLARDAGNPADKGYEDPRHCLVLWARPSREVVRLIEEIQGRLKAKFPTLYTPAPSALHITVLELAHSRTAPEIQSLLQQLTLPTARTIVNYPITLPAHKLPVLVNPMIGFDAAALALGFVPDEATGTHHPTTAQDKGAHGGRQSEDSNDAVYTYHHLRRDIYTLCRSAGLDVASRYVVPSAHVTIARWVDQSVAQEGRLSEFIECVEEINEEMRKRFWGEGAGGSADVNVGVDMAEVSGEADPGENHPLRWRIGEEKGLVCRMGTVWYGGGESFVEGVARGDVHVEGEV